MSLLKQWKNLKLLTIGNRLPDDDDLLSSVIGDIGFVGQINDRVDIDDDIFYHGGGMKLEVDNNNDANKASVLVVEAANEQLSGPNGLFSGGHPSRTLFVRNINRNVEDAELRALFEQNGYHKPNQLEWFLQIHQLKDHKLHRVRSLEVDFEKHKVVVVGDNITPFEILNGVSKVKFVELWLDP
ncbi:hypothetical protein ZIOFF_005923 [Zingiber officinale]|uniref:Uncharacterized protein n=1 Tax=Zingiber officinale TaxID=94328 RepID=A0A8J5HY17_ZINOF|nr:hypothetical protein ZIOFF_005923 [Zingiber officinale]